MSGLSDNMMFNNFTKANLTLRVPTSMMFTFLGNSFNKCPSLLINAREELNFLLSIFLSNDIKTLSAPPNFKDGAKNRIFFFKKFYTNIKIVLNIELNDWFHHP